MKLTTLLTAMILGLATFNGYAEDKKPVKAKKAQTHCPVMNGEINKEKFVDVKGKRIYVCCPPCIAKIKKNPDKYIKILEDKGVTLEEAPKAKEKKK